jgi:hypothetical protein
MKNLMHLAVASALAVLSLPTLAAPIAGTEMGTGFNAVSKVNVTGANGGNNAGGTDKNREELTVAVLDGAKPVAGAKCTLTNAKGDWSLSAPDTVKVKRSDSDLQIKCEAPGYESITQALKASTTQVPRPQFKFSADAGGAGDDDNSEITVPSYTANITITLAAKSPPQAAN